jgi:putative lipoprotein (rSAM/lipoprotein system)
MSNQILKNIKRLLLMGLAAISGAGVTGCMYGAPVSDRLAINGRVTKSDGTPISGIHITVKSPYSEIQWSDVISNTEGYYDFNKFPYPGGESITITATDVDGPLNGGDFATKSQVINAPSIHQDSSKSFDVDFKLDPKP